MALKNVVRVENGKVLGANIDEYTVVAMSIAEHDALEEDLPNNTICFCYEDGGET